MKVTANDFDGDETTIETYQNGDSIVLSTNRNDEWIQSDYWIEIGQ